MGRRRPAPLDLVRAEDACHTLNLRLVDLFHDVRTADDADLAAAPRPVPRRIGHDQRNGRLQLGQIHLSLQHDPLAGGTVCAGLTAAGMPVGSSWSDPNTVTWWCCGQRRRWKRRSASMRCPRPAPRLSLVATG